EKFSRAHTPIWCMTEGSSDVQADRTPTGQTPNQDVNHAFGPGAARSAASPACLSRYAPRVLVCHPQRGAALVAARRQPVRATRGGPGEIIEDACAGTPDHRSEDGCGVKAFPPRAQYVAYEAWQ